MLLRPGSAYPWGRRTTEPVISQMKLIAEPWDLGPVGYQVGEPGTLGEFASRITGSADLCEHTRRRPVASINFVTAHDGYTLRDLVSYNHKHNDANGENNNDGESHNRSWGCGAEGPTTDPLILALRAQQSRNFLATLLLSQGVPMLSHGDELGCTQHGNDNAYSQDNAIIWVDWAATDGATTSPTSPGCGTTEAR